MNESLKIKIIETIATLAVIFFAILMSVNFYTLKQRTETREQYEERINELEEENLRQKYLIKYYEDNKDLLDRVVELEWKVRYLDETN